MAVAIGAGGYTSACAGLAASLRRAGFPEWRIPLAVAVAWAESGCRNDATAQCPPRCVPGQAPEYSVGAWQVNLYAHRDTVGRIAPGVRPEVCLRDPDCAARVVSQISGAGANWNPWTVYRSGAYANAPWLTGRGAALPDISLPSFSGPFGRAFDPRQVTQAVLIIVLVTAAVYALRKGRR